MARLEAKGDGMGNERLDIVEYLNNEIARVREARVSNQSLDSDAYYRAGVRQGSLSTLRRIKSRIMTDRDYGDG